MSNLVKQEETEMKLAGLTGESGPYNGMIAEAVMALVKTHSEQGHSGGSHSLTLAIFNKVINYEPLSEIKKEDFAEVSPGIWQCSRHSTMFSFDGGVTCYDIDDPKKINWPASKL